MSTVPATEARLVERHATEPRERRWLAVEVVVFGDVPRAVELELEELPDAGDHRIDVVLFEPDLSPPLTVLAGFSERIEVAAPIPSLPTASKGSAELYRVEHTNAEPIGTLVTLYGPDSDGDLTAPLWRWSPDEGVVDVEAEDLEADEEAKAEAPPTTTVEEELDARTVDVDPNDPLSYTLGNPDDPHGLDAMRRASMLELEGGELPEPNTAPPTGGELCDVGKVLEAVEDRLRGSPVIVEVLVYNGDGEVVGTVVNAGWGYVFRSEERSDLLVGVHRFAKAEVERLAAAGVIDLIDR